MKTKIPHNFQWLAIVILAIGIMTLALSGYLNQILGEAVRPLVSIQGWFANRFTTVYEFLTIPRDVASLRQRNAELEDQVAELQTRIIQLDQQLREAQLLYALLQFARSNPQNEYVAAAVIGEDPSPFMQYVILDKGSDEGIQHGMPVVTEQGLVGRVDAVIASASRVQLLTDSNSAVNIRFKDSDIEGLLVGSLTGDLAVQMIQQDEEVKIGELILTSGLGGDYPTDIVVGKITGARKLETDLFQTATVQASVDFNMLRAVLVIKNFRPIDTSPLLTTPVAQ
jgi:rod shape-determining protein MreC